MKSPAPAPTRPRGRRAACRVMALGLGGPTGSSYSSGAKVTVKESITVYHVPKLKGTNLKGHTGTVVAIIYKHNDIPISSTLPVKVRHGAGRGCLAGPPRDRAYG